jgi:hypothetical protein
MVLFASPVPVKTGELLFEPETGDTLTTLGRLGAVLSSMYCREVDEQGEVF